MDFTITVEVHFATAHHQKTSPTCLGSAHTGFADPTIARVAKACRWLCAIQHGADSLTQDPKPDLRAIPIGIALGFISEISSNEDWTSFESCARICFP